MKIMTCNIDNAKSYKTMAIAKRAVVKAMEKIENWEDSSVSPKLIFAVNNDGRIVPVILNAKAWALAFIELGFFVAG